MKKDIYILGIETSCDDTCAAVVKNGTGILSNIVSSQNEIHEKYGGVVPEIASRRHIEVINFVIKDALEKACCDLDMINAVSVTNRPGLIGSLLVGVGAAKAISYAKKIPLIAVNHLQAHIYSNVLFDSEVKPGFIGLIVSGGHSSLYLIDQNWKMKEIGHTLDDAAGEAFDKIARFLKLGYPGGPIIDKLAKEGREDFIIFPRPMIDSGDFNFSFSGLKTALIYATKRNQELLSQKNMPDLAASFQKSIIDVLVQKTITACKKFYLNKILISGGVAANSRLREEFVKKGLENGINISIPPLHLCMDNAAMVACVGYYNLISGLTSSTGRSMGFGQKIDVFSRSDI